MRHLKETCILVLTYILAISSLDAAPSPTSQTDTDRAPTTYFCTNRDSTLSFETSESWQPQSTDASLCNVVFDLQSRDTVLLTHIIAQDSATTKGNEIFPQNFNFNSYRAALLSTLTQYDDKIPEGLASDSFLEVLDVRRGDPITIGKITVDVVKFLPRAESGSKALAQKNGTATNHAAVVVIVPIESPWEKLPNQVIFVMRSSSQTDFDKNYQRFRNTIRSIRSWSTQSQGRDAGLGVKAGS